MTAVAEAIRRQLETHLSPISLEITDDSHLHAGHAGARAGGESHFSVTLQSPAFTGLGRVARQRLVYAALADLLSGPVHALALKTLAPGEV